MNRLSLSWRLSLSYAAIALLTAFVSGAAMLSLLANYYDRAEHTALIQSADRVVDDLSRTGLAGHPTSITATQAQALAVVADARVRVYDFAHKLLADSGPVENVDAGAFLAPGRLRFFGMQRFPGMRPSPFGGGPLGMAGTTPIERSANVIAWAQIPLSGRAIGFVELSDPPAYGRDLLVGAGEAWMLASLLAVAVAFAVGWRLSKRITTPLAALTSASDWMAEGDLGARAVVPGGDEFGRLAASFNGMADRVEETVGTLRRFVGDAAHEIGTPLTALQADLELAQERTGDPDQDRLLDRALVQARRIEGLSAGLLQLSRLEARQGSSEPDVSDLTQIVRHSADAAASRAEQAGLDFSLEVPDERILVAAPESLVRTAVENLLDNALKFTSAGRVLLAANVEAAVAVVVVEDSGIGIPAEDVDSLFERFHRGRNAAAYPGSGLGLAIVKATAKAYGGTVGIGSGPHGTRVELRLPLAEAPGA